VRVITGQAKGARLKSLRQTGLRPTSSLVRNAIFSALQARIDPGARVLDLYAGTGALGIEALSRGAGWCDFVEQDPRTAKLIGENLSSLSLSEQSRVICAPALRVIATMDGAYDLVLADPPYASTDAPELLRLLVSRSLIAKGGVVVIEHAWRDGAPAAPAGLSLDKTRRYGDTAVSYYIRMASQ
jgi:16S rRNA (guanine966-N2)-methyltransferase